MTEIQATATTTVPGIIRFRKKPLTVETLEWTGENYRSLSAFTGQQVRRAAMGGLEVWNEEERDWIACPIGHRVVRGALGEFYPISPEAVARTYEPDDDAGIPVSAADLVAAAAVAERAQEALAELRDENEHLKSALAGDNEGVRLWMLDCARLVNRHRERGDAAEAALARLGRDLRGLIRHWRAEAANWDGFTVQGDDYRNGGFAERAARYAACADSAEEVLAGLGCKAPERVDGHTGDAP